MKRSSWLLVVVLLAVGGGLYVATVSGGLSLKAGLLGTGEQAFLRDRTIDFLEDIKFKDFKKASSYHLAETQKARDIPELIRRVFHIKPEVLDIQDYEILEVELDRAGQRARVRAFIRYRIIGDKRIREDKDAKRDTEMFVYWFKQPDGTWVMEFESSLR